MVKARTPFINHIVGCSACSQEPYEVCAEGSRLWRGDHLEMDAVNLQIHLRTKQYRLQRQMTDMAEASEQAALVEWPDVIGECGKRY